MSRIHRDAPSALPSKNRTYLTPGAPTFDFSVLLVPGTAAAAPLICDSARADSSAEDPPGPESSLLNTQPAHALFRPIGQLGSLLQSAKLSFPRAHLLPPDTRDAQPNSDTAVPMHAGLLAMTGGGFAYAVPTLPPGPPSLCEPIGGSDRVALPPAPSPSPMAEATPFIASDLVESTHEGPFTSRLVAGIAPIPWEKAATDPLLESAGAIVCVSEGVRVAPVSESAATIPPPTQVDDEQDGAPSSAIENLPAPVRNWSGQGDRLFDLSAWARGLLSYGAADCAPSEPAESARAQSRGLKKPVEQRLPLVATVAALPGSAPTEALHREPRALTAEITRRRAIEVEARTSTPDDLPLLDVAELAPPRQVLLVVREDSAVLYVRDYFAQATGLELVVEQVRKLLLTKNRAGLRVVINGHWQTTEQNRRGSDGN